MKTIQDQLALFQITKKKGPTSERADLLQQICDATGIPFDMLLKNTFHLKGEKGNEILQIILDDSLRYSTDREWRRWKCAELIKKSKGPRKLSPVPA